jgi:SusD/RagB-like outer membrane lipoprotein
MGIPAFQTLLPIPQGEIDTTLPALTQNPGY